MTTQRIIVIGSGFGGLAAAIRLASRGHEVTIVEKRDQPGGRAYVYRQDGFTFDGGPTVITAPWLIRDLFELSGRNADDYVTMVPVDPFYRIFFPDGSHFDYTGEQDRMIAEMRRIGASEADVTGYRDFVEMSRKIFAKGFTDLADVPFLTFKDMMAIAPDLVKLKSFLSVYDFVAQRVKEPRLRQALSFHPLLVGGIPSRHRASTP